MRNEYRTLCIVERLQSFPKISNSVIFLIQGQLDKLHQEISKTLEKIASREKYINNQVSRATSVLSGKSEKQFERLPLRKRF